MISQIFLLFNVVLKAFGLWEMFLDSIDKADLAAIETRRQERAKAAEEIKNSTSEDEFDKASDKFHDNFPRP